IVTINTSVAKSREIIERLTAAPFFDPSEYSIASDSERAILSSDSRADLTVPMTQPTMEVLSLLWQRSQITAGYLWRALASALILAYAMMTNQLILIVAALLFKPFLEQIQAVGAAFVNK